VLREKFASKLLITEERQLQEQLTAVRNSAINTIDRDEKGAERALSELELLGENFAKEIGKDILAVEKVVVDDVSGLEKEIEKDLGLQRKR
jgi:hypothetical protein